MPTHRYQLTRFSANKKLGGLPASATSRSTCPTRCSFKDDGGCYAENFHLKINWNHLDRGTRGTDLDTFCAEIRTLPKGQMWRWAQAGDLPGDQVLIDAVSLHKIVSANRGRSGFGFTHYDPRIPANARAIHGANSQGFTVAMSAETLAEVDEFMALKIGPVVTILPVDATETFKTPAGHTVIVCLAVTSGLSCATCGICAVYPRNAVIGFPAHGTSKKKAEKVFWARQEEQQELQAA